MVIWYTSRAKIANKNLLDRVCITAYIGFTMPSRTRSSVTTLEAEPASSGGESGAISIELRDPGTGAASLHGAAPVQVSLPRNLVTGRPVLETGFASQQVSALADLGNVGRKVGAIGLKPMTPSVSSDFPRCGLRHANGCNCMPNGKGRAPVGRRDQLARMHGSEAPVARLAWRRLYRSAVRSRVSGLSSPLRCQTSCAPGKPVPCAGSAAGVGPCLPIRV